jgi:GT2 family glycosyltransferase
MAPAPPTDAPQPRARLAVVVLTWNGRDDTLACLESLRASLGPGDAAIVADNGSSDGTEAAVRAAHPWAEFLQNGANLGYAGGNNAGLRRALDRGFAWVLLLNNDTIVPPGAVAALLDYAATRPGTAAFQPLLVRAAHPATVDSAGHVVFRVPGASDALMGRPVAEAPREPVEVFGACAAAALLRADALRRAGLLDPAFFVLLEDVDLMFRLQCGGGAVELVPSVRVHHKRGVSGGAHGGAAALRRRFWLRRNSVALALRWWPLRWLALAAPVLLLRAAQALLLARRLPGESCLPLWRTSRAARRRNRRAMRARGLDRWFAVRPRDWQPAPAG